MTDVYVLASGQSMSAELALSVKNKGIIIAVSDTYKIAEFADAIVSTDKSWWDLNYEQVKLLNKPTFSFQEVYDCKVVSKAKSFENSSVLAVRTAIQYYNAKRIILLGVDMYGTHFFGKHDKLKNTSEERFKVFQEQFLFIKFECESLGIELLNAGKNSKLQHVKKIDLGDL